MKKNLPVFLFLFFIFFIFGCNSTTNVSQTTQTGQVLFISDLHFTPFSDPTVFDRLVNRTAEEWEDIFRSTPLNWGDYGQGTTAWLFLSIMENLKTRAAQADFVVFLGDVLAHHYKRDFYKLYGCEDRTALEAFIYKTYQFFYLSINKALPDKKIIFTPGNNDYYCGDYEIQPNGKFLADLAKLSSEYLDLGTDDQSAYNLTFPKGGYYKMNFPGRPGQEIIVLNNIFYSSNYSNACGSEPDEIAGWEELEWLKNQLETARKENRRVWLMQHIPLGLNIFGTVSKHLKNGRIDQALNFWQDDFAIAMQTILTQYSDVITATFSGHTHQDDIRVDAEKGLFTKIVPSLSPVFDNNPGYILASYSADDMSILDYQVIYLDIEQYKNATFGQEQWLAEYGYLATYGIQGVNTCSLDYLHQLYQDQIDLKDKYETLYDVSNTTNDPMPNADSFQAYWCGQSEWLAGGFMDCFDGR